MPDVLFAKKAILPSGNANVLQSLNMAAAFAEAGGATVFYPGLACEKGADTANRIAAICDENGLDAATADSWSFLNGSHKGRYGLSLRGRTALWYLSKKLGLAYARDIGEAVFLARLRQFFGVRNRFLFEMHEVLHVQHQRPFSRFDWQTTRRKESTVFRSIDGLVAINEALVEQAGEYFGYHGPSLVEPSGFNPKLFFPIPLFSADAPWPDAEDEVRLVYIGSQRRGKGVKELMQAMALLPKRFRLKVIGGGDRKYVSDMRRRAREIPGWQERIEFTGQIAPNCVRTACLRGHISVMPQQETQGYFSPLKLNEALAMGMPLVATPLKTFGSHCDLLHFAKDSSPEGLAAGIEELAATPGLAERLRRDGIEACREATWKARASRILDFFMSLP